MCKDNTLFLNDYAFFEYFFQNYQQVRDMRFIFKYLQILKNYISNNESGLL